MQKYASRPLRRWKKVFPGPGYYNEVVVGILEFIGGPEYLDPSNVPKHIMDRVSLEALSFTKTACKNWPTARSQTYFVDKYTKPGGFLNNYIRVPGPYKREVVIPPKKKTTKNNRGKKPRKRKPFNKKGPRARRYDSKRVREAAFNDVNLVIYTAGNMAKGINKDLGYVLKQMAKTPGLATHLKKELKKVRRRKQKGKGNFFFLSYRYNTAGIIPIKRILILQVILTLVDS